MKILVLLLSAVLCLPAAASAQFAQQPPAGFLPLKTIGGDPCDKRINNRANDDISVMFYTRSAEMVGDKEFAMLTSTDPAFPAAVYEAMWNIPINIEFRATTSDIFFQCWMTQTTNGANINHGELVIHVNKDLAIDRIKKKAASGAAAIFGVTAAMIGGVAQGLGCPARNPAACKAAYLASAALAANAVAMNKAASDPIRWDYTTIDEPWFGSPPRVPDVGSISSGTRRAEQRFLLRTYRTVGYVIAATTAADRQLGAFEAGDTYWAQIQSDTARWYLANAGAEMQEAANQLHRMADGWTPYAGNLFMWGGNPMVDFQNELKWGGPARDELYALWGDMGLSGEDQNIAQMMVTSAFYPQNFPFESWVVLPWGPLSPPSSDFPEFLHDAAHWLRVTGEEFNQ